MRIFTADALSEDVEGNLWIGAPNQLMRWRDGSFDQYLKSSSRGHRAVHVCLTCSLRPASPPRPTVPCGPPFRGKHSVCSGSLAVCQRERPFQESTRHAVTSLFIDRDHSLWMGTRERRGLQSGRSSAWIISAAKHGLSSNAVNSFFEDREGNIWLATSKGLDCFARARSWRFRRRTSSPPRLSRPCSRLTTGPSGSAARRSLDALRGDNVTSIRMPGRSLTSSLAGPGGTSLGRHRLRTERLRSWSVPCHRSDPMGAPSGWSPRSQRIATTTCWVSVDVGPSERKLFRIRDLRVQEEFAPDRIPLVRRIAADPTGGIWLGFEDGNLGHYQSGKLEIFPLPNGSVRTGFTRDA